MCCKRNDFSFQFGVLACFMLLWACGLEKKPPPLLITAIHEGKVMLSDSSTVPIPHYGDTSWIIFYCVRHAEKKKDAGDNPGLTPEGEARAKRLGQILKDVPLDKACSTNFKRTVQTAELARKEMPKPPAAEAFPPDFQDTWLEETLRAGPGKQYLVAGHTNTIPKLLNTLKGSSAFQDIPDDEYDHFYIAVTKGIGQTEVLELHY